MLYTILCIIGCLVLLPLFLAALEVALFLVSALVLPVAAWLFYINDNMVGVFFCGLLGIILMIHLFIKEHE